MKQMQFAGPQEQGRARSHRQCRTRGDQEKRGPFGEASTYAFCHASFDSCENALVITGKLFQDLQPSTSQRPDLRRLGQNLHSSLEHHGAVLTEGRVWADCYVVLVPFAFRSAHKDAYCLDICIDMLPCGHS